jgi:hypothetical protein
LLDLIEVIFLFGRKNNDKDKSIIEACESLFDIIKNSNEENKELENIKSLYNNIREYYIKKIDSDENFIIYEKIRLEKSLGKYTKNTLGITLNIGAIIFSVLVTLFIESMGIFDRVNISMFIEIVNVILNCLIKVGVFFFMIFVFTHTYVDKNVKKDRNEEILNNIRLKVLNDIEREIEIEDKNEVFESSNTKTEYKFIKEVAVSAGVGSIFNVISNVILKRFFKGK